LPWDKSNKIKIKFLAIDNSKKYRITCATTDDIQFNYTSECPFDVATNKPKPEKPSHSSRMSISSSSTYL
jgi:hypothetical protein